MKVDLPSAWTLSESQQDGSLLYCMLRSDPPMVIRSVTVSSDLHGYAHVLNKVVPRSNSVIQTLPVKVSSAESSPLQILKAIQSAKLCPGNPEEQFVHLFEQKLCIRSSYNSAYLDNKGEIVVGNTKYHKTVRKSDCEMICSPHTSSFQHSPHCSKFHSQLFVERNRESKKSKVIRTKHDSHVNYRCLTSSEKDERMRHLENAKRAEKQSNWRLQNVLMKKSKRKVLL